MHRLSVLKLDRNVGPPFISSNAFRSSGSPQYAHTYYVFSAPAPLPMRDKLRQSRSESPPLRLMTPKDQPKSKRWDKHDLYLVGEYIHTRAVCYLPQAHIVGSYCAHVLCESHPNYLCDFSVIFSSIPSFGLTSSSSFGSFQSS